MHNMHMHVLMHADGECVVVQVVVDGTFYGSKDGVWGGEAGFKYTHALYRVDLQHYDNSGTF